MVSSEKSKLTASQYHPHLSVYLTIILTIAALVLGWFLMNQATNRTVQITHSGISASIPSGWMVVYGIQNEEMLFWTSDQLDLDHRFVVSRLPAVPNGAITDVVVGRNLDRGQSLSTYQVVSQSPTWIHNQEAYQVHFAYIKPGNPGSIPKVIQGMDYYLLFGDQVLVVTLESNSSSYDQSLPEFLRFLDSVHLASGG